MCTFVNSVGHDIEGSGFGDRRHCEESPAPSEGKGTRASCVEGGWTEASFAEEGLDEENHSNAAMVYIRIGNGIRSQGGNAWEMVRTCKISLKRSRRCESRKTPFDPLRYRFRIR